MPNIHNTQTEKNLALAFFKESEAHNLYTYFASIAAKEGFVQVKNIFLETAKQEQQHAKMLLKHLNGGHINLQLDTDIAVLGTTAENLSSAMKGESHEFENMYPLFANIAETEGFNAIAKNLRAIAEAERGHHERFQILYNNIINDSVFKKPQPVRWRCANCGHIHESTEALQTCPACFHPQAHFYPIEAF